MVLSCLEAYQSIKQQPLLELVQVNFKVLEFQVLLDRDKLDLLARELACSSEMECLTLMELDL